MKICKEVEFEYLPNAREVAEYITNNSDLFQIELLNHCVELIGKWDINYVFQLQAICDGDLTHDARDLMQRIGEYAHREDSV